MSRATRPDERRAARLKALLALEADRHALLDRREVTLVDRDAVGSLARVEAAGPAREAAGISPLDYAMREEPTCPACIAGAALVVAGATSTGGLIALVVKKLPAKTGGKLGKE